MQNLFQDIRYALRTFVRNPSVSLIAIVALAVGIGANTAIFSVVNSVLLKPLPFQEPDRLVALWESNVRQESIVAGGATSYLDFVDWRARNHVFERMAAYRDRDFSIGGGGDPAHIHGAVASADLFNVLGRSPALGHGFSPEDDNPGGTHAVVLSSGLWQRRFGGDRSVIGREMIMDGKTVTITGVMPAGFQFPIEAEPVEIWTAMATERESADGGPTLADQRGAHYLRVVARLRPGISLAQAQSDMDSITKSLASEYPDSNSNFAAGMLPLHESIVGDLRTPLLILLGAVGCVLLIACANVANLLLARSASRYKEIAIRAALGARRSRVIRQLLTESVMLSALGGAAGLLVAVWGADLLLALVPSDLPRLSEIHMDWRVLGFTLVISVATGIIFGLAPALNASSTNLSETLKEGGRGSTEGVHGNRIRNALVISEVALSLVLLVGAGLLMQSLVRLERVNPGFDPHNVLALSLDLPETRYPKDEQVGDFVRQLQSRLTGVPGIVASSAVTPLPLSSKNLGVAFDVEGRPMSKGEMPSTDLRIVSPDYFRVMGIPLVAGRDFTTRDGWKASPVIIINQTLARRYFPNQDPIGKHIRPTVSAGDQPEMREIVGVVGDIRHASLTAELKPEVYLPHAQIPANSMTLVVRTNSDPSAVIPAIRGAVREMDPDLPLFNIRTLDQYVLRSASRPRFNSALLATFACVALLLTAIGLYGVMAYSVAQRTHEIGIRMALGARTSNVLGLVVRQGMKLTAAGLAIGLIGAFAATRMLAGLLFGVSPTDPLTFIGVSALIATVALLACYLPARRATKVDPLIALRYE